jgi:hypothetical protein
MNAHACATMVQELKFVVQLKDIQDNMDEIHIFNAQWWYKIFKHNKPPPMFKFFFMQ